MFECFLNVYSCDVVVKMDTTSSHSEYHSDIDWTDDSDLEFMDDAEESILKGIKFSYLYLLNIQVYQKSFMTDSDLNNNTNFFSIALLLAFGCASHRQNLLFFERVNFAYKTGIRTLES